MRENTLADIRHPEARHKTRNRSGQAAGISKMSIGGVFSWRLIEMQECPAYRVLSLSARRILDRLEIELQRHGGKSEENGQLPCTYDDFVEYGVDRHAIAPAVRELVALGFVEITRKGTAGNEFYRQATLFLLTYRHAASDKRVGNGWRRIKTINEAEAIAKSARSRKADERARDFGQRGGRARWRNKTPVMENTPVPVMENTPVPGDGKRTEGGKSPVMETEPLSIYSRGRGISPQSTDDGGRAPTAPTAPPDPLTPTARLLANVAKLPWTPPRWVEITPEIDEALNRVIDGRSMLGQTAPMDAFAEIEGLILSNTLPDGSAMREAVH